MWTAELLSAEDRQTHWKIVVRFSDSDTGDTKKQGYRFNGTTNQQLAAFVRGKAAEFERTDTTADFSTLVGQSIDVTPPTPPTPTPPTAEEIAEAAWFADWRKLNQLRQVLTVVPALADPAANALVASLEASLEAGWLNSYLEKI